MERPTRRGFLGGGALLALGYAGAFVFGHRPLGAIDSPFLGPQRRTLELVFEAMLPTPEDARLVAAGVDAFVAAGDPVTAGQLRMALLVLEHLGGAGPLQTRRFSRLSAEERMRVLRAWETSSIGLQRQIFQALRKTAVFAHYSRPETWEAIGYDGPWVKP